MVNGLEKFRTHFEDYPDSYIVIGGTACDVLLSNAGLQPRATKDIDLILVVNDQMPSFVACVWEFITSGKYQSLQKDDERRQYYRFSKPQEAGFPTQIEIFSRRADSMDGDNEGRFVRIKPGDDVSSLSAILMDGEYYDFTLAHSEIVNGVHIAKKEALICLKVKAFLDLSEKNARGQHIDERDIRKHRNDVLRLAMLVAPAERFTLPADIQRDVRMFSMKVRGNLPDRSILDAMNVSGVGIQELFDQLWENFGVAEP